MDEARVRAFQSTTVEGLAAMAAVYGDLAQRVDAVRPLVPAGALPWYEELADGFRADYDRAQHAWHLYAGASARRLNELGADEGGMAVALDHFARARATTSDFLLLAQDRAKHYRYPYSYSSGWRRSVTSYDYRYLWTVAHAYFYKRAEKQAIEKDFNPLLDNLIDPIWFFE